METRGGSRTVATSKMERFVIIVNGWKPLTIITKRSILNVAVVLDAPLETHSFHRVSGESRFRFKISKKSLFDYYGNPIWYRIIGYRILDKEVVCWRLKRNAEVHIYYKWDISLVLKIIYSDIKAVWVISPRLYQNLLGNISDSTSSSGVTKLYSKH